MRIALDPKTVALREQRGKPRSNHKVGKAHHGKAGLMAILVRGEKIMICSPIDDIPRGVHGRSDYVEVHSAYAKPWLPYYVLLAVMMREIAGYLRYCDSRRLLGISIGCL